MAERLVIDFVPGQFGLKRRLFIGTFLWAMLLLERPLQLSPYTAWLISIPLLTWCGKPFHQGLWRCLRVQRADLNMLVSLSAWGAFLFSTAAVFAPDLLPAAAREHRLKTMAALIVLSTLGKWIERLLEKDTGLALERLARRVPATARVLREGGEKSLPLEEVRPGDRIVVLAGELVPLDGEVLEGFSSVEESLWTGFTTPVEKSPGSRVPAGTVNKSARLVVGVFRDRASMPLTRIITQAREGLESKRPGLKLADGLARGYVPAAVCLCVLAALLWSWKGPEPREASAFTALTLALVAACPWSAALATPLSILAGMRRAGELGVVVRNPDLLEWMQRPDVVLVDKKGVLTRGRPEVSEVICFGSWTEEALLRVAMGAESRSSHMYAEALRRRSAGPAAVAEAPRPRERKGERLEAFEAYPGRGVWATLGGRRVLAGSLAWLRENGIEPEGQAAVRLQSIGESLVGVAVDGKLAGAIAFSDPLRPEAPAEVRELEAMGVQVVLASGDRNATAHLVAQQVGIGRVYAEVEAEEKVRIVAELQAQGKKVAVMGEGLRDAPALSRADLGIVPARTAGTSAELDLALESADLVLPSRDLAALARAFRLSARIRALTRQNLTLAFLWNVLLLPVAGGALMPALGWGWSPLWHWGAGLLSFASIFANSWRLWRFVP